MSFPSTIDAACTFEQGTNSEYQRKSFYAVGRFWEFYQTNGVLCFRSSTDGITWSEREDLVSMEMDEGFSLYFDGTYVHLVMNKDYSEITYARGLPQEDGNISFAGEHSVITGTVAFPTVTVDGDGYPWVGYMDAVDMVPKVTKSSTKDGTWTTDTGFPFQLTTATGFWFKTCPLVLGNGKIIVVYWENNSYYARRWEGTIFGAEKIRSYSAGGIHRFSCIGGQNEARFCYWDSPNRDFRENVFDYDTNDWGTEEIIDDTESERDICQISWDQENDTFYYIWFIWPVGPPTTVTFVYKKRVNGVLDSEITEWFSAPNLAEGGPPVNVYAGAYGSYIGISFLCTPEPPYSLMFNRIQTLVPIELTLFETLQFSPKLRVRGGTPTLGQKVTVYLVRKLKTSIRIRRKNE